MIIKLWGVRGSLPSPLRNEEYNQKLQEILARALQAGLSHESQIVDFLKSLPSSLRNNVGGNTTCVSVNIPSIPLPIILDAGSGIRSLGDELIATDQLQGNPVITLFLSHTHWDHIQGLPFFKPVYFPNVTIRVISPIPDMEDRLRYQFDPRFFPVPFDDLGARFEFVTLVKEKPFMLDDGETVVDSLPLRHPGGSFAYRFKSRDGATFIFATDAEFTGADLEQSDLHTDFFSGADLVMIDAQYTLDESFQKFDWGHTSNTMAANCGVRWGVKNMILTHHEPAYSDERLAQNLEVTIEHRNLQSSDIPVIYMAVEGNEYILNREAGN